MIKSRTILKLKTLLFTVVGLLLFSCGTAVSGDVTSEASADGGKDIQIPVIKNPEVGYFNRAPLDSLMERDAETVIINSGEFNESSYPLFEKNLLSLFDSEGLSTISYTYVPKEEEDRPPSILPGLVNLLKFKDQESAMKTYNRFKTEVLSGKLVGKISLKNGGICFVHKQSIYVFGLSTCGSDKEYLQNYVDVLTKHVFKSTRFDALIMRCGLKKEEVLVFEKN